MYHPYTCMRLSNSRLIKISKINLKSPSHKKARNRRGRFKGLEPGGKKALNKRKDEIMVAEDAGKTKEPRSLGDLQVKMERPLNDQTLIKCQGNAFYNE